MTQIIAFGTEKGGVGKTTLATNFSATSAEQGFKVRVFDSDKSENAYTWLRVRRESGDLPPISGVKVRGDFRADVLADRDSFDRIIIDTPGDLDTELRAAVAVADVFVVPLRIGQFDVWSLGHIAKMVRDVRMTGKKLRAIAVINAVPFNIKQELREAQDELATMSDVFEVAPHLIDRPAYRTGSRGGWAIHEVPAEFIEDARIHKKACAEFRAFYDEVARD